VPGETEHITFGGKRIRRPTVLIKVGKWSLSKKAAILGLLLAACQVLDGLLTYIGLKIYGHTEGNSLMRLMMEMYGVAPALSIAKLLALFIVAVLTFYAHQRRWIRPLIFSLVAIYFVLAILPWSFLISRGSVQNKTISAVLAAE